MLHTRITPFALAIVPVVAIASASTTARADACEIALDPAAAPACSDSPEDLACDAMPSLLDFIDCVELASPSAETELYTFPTIAETLDFAFVVEQMMTDMDDGVFDCDAVVPPGLDAHYRVSVMTSNGRELCVFSEFLDADLDGYADLGWGTFLYAPDARNEILLQAPHIRVDIHTETQVVDLFEQSWSRSALLGGAHRLANAAITSCQGQLTNSDGDPYLEADASHNIDTFYVASKAVAGHYGAEEVGGVIDLTNADPAFHVLQFHAMGVDSCSEHVFLTNGDTSSVLVDDGAQRLAVALSAENPQWDVRYRGDGTTCTRYGRDNTLSRYINGVPDNGDNDIDNSICSHSGNHPAVSARFIHIEQKRCISGTACSYGDPGGIRTAEFWTQAVSAAFDVPTCTDGIHDGTETGIDCGGPCPLPCGAPSCTDGVHNGTETDIDCGGSCPACPSCTDGIQNGGETGIDCGGSCPAPACLPPGQGMACVPTTPCCNGVGHCSGGKPSDRVCL
jgi:hypothetical protein